MTAHIGCELIVNCRTACGVLDYAVLRICNAVVGKQTDREPSLPWVDQWDGKYEDVTFDAAGSKVTVTDVMGNSKVYTAKNGKVTVPVSGSPLYISGIR